LTGYPLPTLLRIALLVLHTPPFKPLDIVLSYAHLTLQNSTFDDFIPHFRERAQVKQLVAASPLSMALLTPTPPPWHPAPKQLREAVAKEAWASEVVSWPGSLPNLALGYSIRKAIGAGIQLAVGLSNVSEVHECMKVWREEVSEEVDKGERRRIEENVRERIGQSGFLDWSWVTR
jgi:D-arabinose 1-dehydrogenase